jgi:pSer/pThr/pTyr-binding forkhead associated (FHA) protein
MVTDYSTNGTFIDGGSRLVANVPTPIQRGTVIALGSRENRFRLN